MEKTKYLFVLLLAISLVSFKFLNQDNPAKQIIGTWIAERATINERRFYKSNGICKTFIKNKLYKTYRYTLTQEKSLDGTLTFDVLTLTNINDSEDVYDYTIDAMTDSIMRLEWSKRPGHYLLYNKHK